MADSLQPSSWNSPPPPCSPWLCTVGCSQRRLQALSARSASGGPTSSCGPAQLTWSSTSPGLIHSLLPLLLALRPAAQCCLRLWLKSSHCAAPAFPIRTSEETRQPTLCLTCPRPAPPPQVATDLGALGPVELPRPRGPPSSGTCVPGSLPPSPACLWIPSDKKDAACGPLVTVRSAQ